METGLAGMEIKQVICVVVDNRIRTEGTILPLDLYYAKPLLYKWTKQ